MASKCAEKEEAGSPSGGGGRLTTIFRLDDERSRSEQPSVLDVTSFSKQLVVFFSAMGSAAGETRAVAVTAGQHGVGLWNCDSGELLRELMTTSGGLDVSVSHLVAFNIGEGVSRVVMCSDEGYGVMWDGEDGEAIAEWVHGDGGVQATHAYVDERTGQAWWVCGSGSGCVEVRDGRTGELLRTIRHPSGTIW
jgi:hypothetical protein